MNTHSADLPVVLASITSITLNAITHSWFSFGIGLGIGFMIGIFIRFLFIQKAKKSERR